MSDLGRIDPRSLDLIDSVVLELVARTDVCPASIMLIGAYCRDLLHEGFGHTEPLRSTSDLDVALAVDGEAEYFRITEALPKSGSTEIRFSIAGMAVDMVPFGEIEDPAGTSSLSNRRDSLDVFGFREVFAEAIRLPLPSGYRIAIPSPAGYTALKLKAWCDRSPYGEYKDAADIATICTWYQEDADVRSSLYGGRTDLLIEADMDIGIASLRILGEEVSATLGNVRTAELATAWQSTDRDLLAHYFALSRSSRRPDLTAAHTAIRAATDFLLA